MDGLLEDDSDFLRPPWGRAGRDFTLGAVAGASKLLLQVLNTTIVAGRDTFHDLVMRRPPGVGLLTYANHTSTFDDPGLLSAMLPWRYFWSEHTHGGNRWTMCAADICFTNDLFRQFFLNGKTLPVDRGAGVEQPVMGVAARRLAGGDWVHIFPEGRVSAEGAILPFKWGIGKLVCDARALNGGRDPLIVPFFHSGMARVMRFREAQPRAGHTVSVVVGRPIDLGHITCKCHQPGCDQQVVWSEIAAAMQQALADLAPQAPPNPDQLAERPELAAEIAAAAAKRRHKRRARLAAQGLHHAAAVQDAWRTQQQATGQRDTAL